MRLRNIYILCKNNLKDIEKLEILDWIVNSDYMQVVNWQSVSEVLYKSLISIEYLKKPINELIESIPVMSRDKDIFAVPKPNAGEIVKKKNKLLTCMVDVINLYESMGMDNDTHTGIDIKLPKCNDFSDLKKCINELDFILYKCPLFIHGNETLKFETIDVGSMWLTFVIVGIGVGATSVLLNNIAAFIDKCLVIKSHKITIDQQKAKLKSLNMEEKAKQELLESLTKVYKVLVENDVKDLEKELGVELRDGDEKGRLLQAIEKTNALLDKGMQLYSSIDSPDEIKALFEPLEMKYLSNVDKDLRLSKKD